MSASVFKPCVLDIPRMRSPLADRRQLLCRGEAFTRVRRVLFEPVDHAETQEFLEKELAKQSIRQLKKWDFNFALEAPLNNPTRYEWTAIISQKNNAAPKKRAARNNVENQQNQEDKSEALYPNFLHEIDEFEKQKKLKQQQSAEQEQEAQAKERVSSSTSNSNNSSTNNQRREKRKTKQEAENEKQNQNVESIEFDESSPLPKKQRLITDFMSMRKQLPSTLMKKKLSSTTTTPKRITTSTTEAAEKSNSNSSSSVPTTNPCNVQPAR